MQQTTIEQLAIEILGRYVTTEAASNDGEQTPPKIVVCEENIKFKVGGHDFVARIDRIDRIGTGHRIIDYKTAASGSMKASTIKKMFINFDEVEDYKPTDFQLPLYLLAARSKGYDPVELSYYWVAQANAKGMFKKSGLSVGEGGPDFLTSEDIEAATRNIIEVVAQISVGSFRPEPASTYACGRCEFNSICGVDQRDDDDE
jgi:ATP-dependent helicase/DNAse subunit B